MPLFCVRLWKILKRKERNFALYCNLSQIVVQISAKIHILYIEFPQIMVVYLSKRGSGFPDYYSRLEFIKDLEEYLCYE